MPDPDARADRWTIDFYTVDSGRMVGRVASDGPTLKVDRVQALVSGMSANEIYARHAKWTDGEIESRLGSPPPASPVAYVSSPDGSVGFLVQFVADQNAQPAAAEPGPGDDHDWGIEEQIRDWEEDPVLFADCYGYSPTDDLPEDDPRHGMRILIEGFDDDYNPIEDDDSDFSEEDEELAQVLRAALDEAPAPGEKKTPVVPSVGRRYRTNTLIPQDDDPSIGPDTLVEVLANSDHGGADVRVVATRQVFFCPWGNLVPEAD